MSHDKMQFCDTIKWKKTDQHPLSLVEKFFNACEGYFSIFSGRKYTICENNDHQCELKGRELKEPGALRFGLTLVSIVTVVVPVFMLIGKVINRCHLNQKIQNQFPMDDQDSGENVEEDDTGVDNQFIDDEIHKEFQRNNSLYLPRSNSHNIGLQRPQQGNKEYKEHFNDKFNNPEVEFEAHITNEDPEPEMTENPSAWMEWYRKQEEKLIVSKKELFEKCLSYPLNNCGQEEIGTKIDNYVNQCGKQSKASSEYNLCRDQWFDVGSVIQLYVQNSQILSPTNWFHVDDQEMVYLINSISENHPASICCATVRIAEQHYVLVFVDKESKTVEYYDGYGNFDRDGSYRNEIGSLVENPENFLYGYTFIDKTASMIQGKSCLQKDTYECGPWALYFAEQRMLDSNFDPNKINKEKAKARIEEYRMHVHIVNILNS